MSVITRKRLPKSNASLRREVASLQRQLHEEWSRESEAIREQGREICALNAKVRQLELMLREADHTLEKSVVCSDHWMNLYLELKNREDTTQ